MSYILEYILDYVLEVSDMIFELYEPSRYLQDGTQAEAAIASTGHLYDLFVSKFTIVRSIS